MRFVSFQSDGSIRPGVVVDQQVVDLHEIAPDLLTLIEMGGEGLERVRSVMTTAPRVSLTSVSLLAPIPRPRQNVVCVGMNYVAHAYESARAKGLPETLPPHPVYFTKAVTSINHPEGTIPYDAAITEQLDWEVELAVVIGRQGKNIAVADVYDYIWGYTIVNDISARDLQNRHQQFFKGKSLDGSCPIGPWIVTADEIPNPHNLRLALRVNGKTLQDSNTGDLIFDIPTLIATLSRGQTLLPGDILSTGTPSGVGMGLNPPSYLRPGDVMEAEVEGIGVLRNTVGQ